MSDKSRWLMLVHQLPGRPAYGRVKIWRLLQQAGAIGLKNAVYVLPPSVETRARFSAILAEIRRRGGDGLLLEAELVAGMSDAQLKGQFNAAREADYDTITAELRRLGRGKGAPAAAALTRVSQRLSELARIDFFGAPGRAAAEALLARMEHSAILRGEPQPKKPTLRDLTGKVWVTRQDIHVDRIACAWLITRFIDPEAALKFVPDKHYLPAQGEYRYDMQDGEFTHEGEDCSFEVLVRRARLIDPALKTIAEIVHDIDLKDGKFNHAETAGISHVIAGICRTQSEDHARVARGGELFDEIYEQFRRRK